MMPSTFINISPTKIGAKTAAINAIKAAKDNLHLGYDFYFKVDNDTVVLLPITPGELTVTIGSNNEVVNLIDEGDINILKSPALVEIEFEARFPMRKYPYSREPYDFKYYWDFFTKLKTEKLPFDFIVIRKNHNVDWDYIKRVALEEMEINESADEGDDVIISFKLKEYKEYGVKILKKSDTTTSTSSKPREEMGKTKNKNITYTVVRGDCLYLIAKKFYDDGSKWPLIYKANKSAIEADAKKHGKSSSSNGHVIYPGLKLIILINDSKKSKDYEGKILKNTNLTTSNKAVKNSG